MAGLPKLPAGCYYRGRSDNEVMDHHGNWYRVENPAPTPAQATKPKPTPPKPITLSESARSAIAAMLPELASKSSEHTLWAITDGTGNLLDAFSTSSGHDNRDESDHKASLEKVIKTAGRKALFLAHNHPRLAEGGGGDPSASADDHKFTAWVKARLEPFDITLLDHHVVGANGQESRSIKEAKAEGTIITEAWQSTIDAVIERLEARKEKIVTASQEPPTLREV